MNLSIKLWKKNKALTRDLFEMHTGVIRGRQCEGSRFCCTRDGITCNCPTTDKNILVIENGGNRSWQVHKYPIKARRQLSWWYPRGQFNIHQQWHRLSGRNVVIHLLSPINFDANNELNYKTLEHQISEKALVIGVGHRFFRLTDSMIVWSWLRFDVSNTLPYSGTYIGS